MELASEIERNVSAALVEDIGPCDWTALLTPAEQIAGAYLICRESAILCGNPWFNACMRRLDAGMLIQWLVAEGARPKGGQVSLIEEAHRGQVERLGGAGMACSK